MNELRTPPCPRVPALVPVIVLALVLVASGCGDGDSVARATRPVAPTSIPAPAATGDSGERLTLQVVDTDAVPGLITDHRGFAVYGNSEETPVDLVCVLECTEIWVPLAPRDPAISDRLESNEFDVFRRPDGSEQVSYRGIALYTWTGDREVGIPAGAGVAGTWFGLAADGGVVR